jgi:hypothetical protein
MKSLISVLNRFFHENSYLTALIVIFRLVVRVTVFAYSRAWKQCCWRNKICLPGNKSPKFGNTFVFQVQLLLGNNVFYELLRF